MPLPDFLETAVQKLEMNLRLLSYYQDGASRRSAADEQMKVVRQREAILGRYLGGTNGARYEDIAHLIDRLRAVTQQLVKFGGTRHRDHCDADGILSHYGFSVLKGAMEKLVHHPLGIGWRGLDWRHIAKIDGELELPALIAGEPHHRLAEIAEAIERRMRLHLSGAHPLSVEEANEAIHFLDGCSSALDKVRDAAQRPPTPHRAKFRHRPNRPNMPMPVNRDGMTVGEFTDWCGAVLDEIERLTSAAREAITVASRSDSSLAYGRGNDLTDGASPGRRLDRIRAEVHAGHLRFMDEPFIIRAELTGGVTQKGTEASSGIYGVSRSPVAGVRVPNVTLASAHSPIGLLLRSLDPGDEVELNLLDRSGLAKLRRRVEVTANGASHVPRDAAVVCDASLQTRSAREWVERMHTATFAASETTKTPNDSRTSDRRRSFELYDQRALYKAQREVLEADFRQPMILMGPAGTGKTTALVKRIVDVLALAYEEDEGLEERQSALGIDRALEEGCPLDRWVMVVPHSDWVRYARKAFRDEGRIDINPDFVRNWANLRGEVHRRHFGASPASESEAGRGAEEDKDSLATETLVAAVVEGIDDELRTSATQALSDLEGPGRGALPRPPRGVSAASTIEKTYATVRGVLTELLEFDLERKARASVAALVERLPDPAGNGQKLTRQVQDVCARAARDAPANGDNAIRELLTNAGVDDETISHAGAVVVAAGAIRTLGQAERRWLEGERSVRENVKVQGIGLSERVLRDLTFLVVLRNARIAYRAALARGLESTLPDLVETRLGLMFGHVYVDEFENRTLLELATLACLTHPAAASITFSGDPEQATETGGTRADLRVTRALELAAMNAAHEIPFERRVRQSTRLAAASDAMRRDVVAGNEITPDDPAIVLAPRLHKSRWGEWVVARLTEVLVAVGGKVTTAVITATREECGVLALRLRERDVPLGLPVLELDERNRPASAEPAIYLASLEEPQLLHGLEFEGVLLMGPAEMLALPQGRNRIYVAMTRAARYLGIACEGELPTELTALRELAGGPSWR